MKENIFFSLDMTVTSIETVWNGLYMPRSNHMTNRPYDGLVLIRNDPRDYIFEITGTYPASDLQTINASPGNILYLPKGSTYRLSDISVCDCISINYHIYENISLSPFIYPVGNHMPLFNEIFMTADHFWNLKCPGYLPKIKSLLYQVLYLMQNNYRPDYIPRRISDKIGLAAEYINLNYMQPTISIENLAQMSDMSTVYFRRIFEKLYGMSPVKYIKQLRIERAIELLKSDMYRIKDIAKLTGYNNEYYFSREFKRATGLAPKEYKNNSISNHTEI